MVMSGRKAVGARHLFSLQAHFQGQKAASKPFKDAFYATSPYEINTFPWCDPKRPHYEILSLVRPIKTIMGSVRYQPVQAFVSMEEKIVGKIRRQAGNSPIFFRFQGLRMTGIPIAHLIHQSNKRGREQ